MNKLKENIFAIGVGGACLGLLVLGYVLIFMPLTTLGQKQAELDTKLKDLKALNDSKKTLFVPTPDYAKELARKQEADEAALKEGEQFYADRTKPFQLFFDDAATPSDSATFVSRYQTEIDKLVTAYREKFKIAAAAGQNPDDLVPKVSKMDLAVADETKMAAAMKEFWIIQDVLNACMELDLGGLQSVDFPGRSAVEKNPHPYYATIIAEIQIDLSFSKKENLLTKILESKRVPFVIDSIVMRKKPEDVAKYQGLELVKVFKQGENPKAKPFEELVPEPNVSVTIRLLGFDWKGIPAPKEEEKKESEDKKDGKKDGKKQPK